MDEGATHERPGEGRRVRRVVARRAGGAMPGPKPWGPAFIDRLTTPAYGALGGIYGALWGPFELARDFANPAHSWVTTVDTQGELGHL